MPSDLGEETSDDTVLYCTDPIRGQKIGFCYSEPCTPIGIMGIRSASSDRELAKEQKVFLFFLWRSCFEHTL